MEIPLVLRDSTEEKEGENLHQQQAEIDSKIKKDVEKKETTTSSNSSNLFLQSEESLQTSE